MSATSPSPGRLRMLARAVLARDPERRHEARFVLLDALARRLGFRLYNRNQLWQQDASYRDTWEQFRPGDRSIRDRKYVAWSLARSVAGLPGDTAECGVLDGGTSFLICLANEQQASAEGRASPCSRRRRHHVFDSFAGLSEPEPGDRPSDARAWKWQRGDLAVPLETVRENLRRFDFVDYHEGWIPDRFADVAERRFCFVHVDVDLYQPTYDSIAFFYDRLVPGGILLCDDYGFTTCPGAKRAFDELIADKPERSVVHLTTGQGLIVKRGEEAG